MIDWRVVFSVIIAILIVSICMSLMAAVTRCLEQAKYVEGQYGKQDKE